MNQKKVIIAGSTGMIGSLVLKRCIGSADVREIVSLVRRPTGYASGKVKEVILSNFKDYSQHEDLFTGKEQPERCAPLFEQQRSQQGGEKSGAVCKVPRHDRKTPSCAGLR